MAILHIDKDIQTEGEKLEAKFWGENEGICFKDVKDFISQIPAEDNKIELFIHCDGGSCTEGWAMYDAFRATGKDIEATIEGNCSSMATVVYMAAPKERRKCQPSAHICVHNPWMSTWGLGSAVNYDDLQKAANELKAEQDRMVDLYVERCGCDREEIQNLMNEDKYIDAQKALELGIVGSIIAPISAHKGPNTAKGNKNNNNQKSNKMAKENENAEVKASLWDKIKAFFKADDEQGVEAALNKGEETKALKLTTADDETELTIERESGSPQVGDAASPDGTFEMPDGSTITISDGAITKITEGSKGKAEGEPVKGKKGDEPDDPKDAKIAELTASLAEKEEAINGLQEKLTKAEAHARTKDDLVILNAVKMAGGISALAKLQSGYQPQGRTPEGKHAQESDKTISAQDILHAFDKK